MFGLDLLSFCIDFEIFLIMIIKKLDRLFISLIIFSDIDEKKKGKNILSLKKYTVAIENNLLAIYVEISHQEACPSPPFDYLRHLMYELSQKF